MSDFIAIKFLKDVNSLIFLLVLSLLMKKHILTKKIINVKNKSNKKYVLNVWKILKILTKI